MNIQNGVSFLPYHQDIKGIKYSISNDTVTVKVFVSYQKKHTKSKQRTNIICIFAEDGLHTCEPISNSPYFCTSLHENSFDCYSC